MCVPGRGNSNCKALGAVTCLACGGDSQKARREPGEEGNVGPDGDGKISKIS